MEKKEKKLLNRIAADTAAAAIAGACVTPFVSSVDRALAENASGKMKLWASAINSFKEMLAAPGKFVTSPQFFWIWLVYGSTYLAANYTDTICAHTEVDPTYPKWASTSVTNTVTCIAKDRAYARIFGTKVNAKVPMASNVAWLVRDVVSMGVFFTLPPLVAPTVAKYTGSDRSGYYAAQIFLPLALQTITTPIHLLGYDIYNHPDKKVGERVAFLKNDYWKTVSIRMLRMAAPWSFGTIGNRELRRMFTEKFTAKAVSSAK